jgi:hypothetical protein
MNDTIYCDTDLVLSEELIERAKALGYSDHRINCMKAYIGKRFSEIDRLCFMTWLDCAALIDGWTSNWSGNRYHHRNGKRQNGPNGEPAILLADGTVGRCRDGKLHDGPNGEPAIVRPDGTVERWRNGVKIS